MLPEYMEYFMWFMSLYGGFNSVKSSSTIAHLTGVKLKKVLTPVPPIKTQEKFKELYTTIGINTENHKSHLIELNKLFASLQQRAFNGTL